MDDTGCRGCFLEPVATSHRQYEALRAFFIEGRRLHDIAQQFGDRETSLRSMVCRFRAQVHAGEAPPLFGPPSLGRPQRQPHVPTPAIPETTVVADARTLSLAPGRRLRTRVAGVFLFLPWWARVRFEHLVSHASSPGSAMVPATRALLSVLVLKLLDKARRSHLHDLNFDAAVGLCAGLKVPPKKSSATDSSYRTIRDHQHK